VLHFFGLDCIVFAVIIYGLDFLKITRGVYFFQVFGRNPLFIYLLSEHGVILLYFFSAGSQSCYEWIYGNVFRHAGSYFGSLLFAVTFMLLCWLAGYFLDKRKIYIRV
jgi:predicted acyltransferase